MAITHGPPPSSFTSYQRPFSGLRSSGQVVLYFSFPKFRVSVGAVQRRVSVLCACVEYIWSNGFARRLSSVLRLRLERLVRWVTGKRRHTFETPLNPPYRDVS